MISAPTDLAGVPVHFPAHCGKVVVYAPISYTGCHHVNPPDNFPCSQDACVELNSQSLNSIEPFIHKPQPSYDNESQVLSEVLQAAIARDVPKVVRLAASLGISQSGSSSLAAVVSSSGDLLPDSTTSKDSAGESTPVDFHVEDDHLGSTTAKPPKSTTSSPEVTQSNIIGDINQVDLDASISSNDNNQGLPECSNPSPPVEADCVFVQSNSMGKPSDGVAHSDLSVKPSKLSKCQSASISSTCPERSVTTTTTLAGQLCASSLTLSMPDCVSSQATVRRAAFHPLSNSSLPPSAIVSTASADQSSRNYSTVPISLPTVVSGMTSLEGHLPPTATGLPVVQSLPAPSSSLPAVISLSLTPVSPNGDFLPVRVSLPGLPDVVMQVLPQPGARVGDSYTIDVPSHLILNGISSALASGTAVNGAPIMLYISPSSSTAIPPSGTATTTAPSPLMPVTGSSQQILGLGDSQALTRFTNTGSSSTPITYTNTTTLPVASQLRQASIITSASAATFNNSGSTTTNKNSKKMRAIAPKPSQSVPVPCRTSSAGLSKYKRQVTTNPTMLTGSTNLVSVSSLVHNPPTGTVTTTSTATTTANVIATPGGPAVHSPSPFVMNSGGRQHHNNTSLSPVRSGRGRRRTGNTMTTNSSGVIGNGVLSTFPCALSNVLLPTSHQSQAGSLSVGGALSDVTAGTMMQQPHLLAPVSGPQAIANMQTAIMSTQPGMFAPQQDINSHPVVAGNSVYHTGAMPFLFGGGGGGAPLVGTANGPSTAYMFQPPFAMPAAAVCGSFPTPPAYTPSSCHLPPTNTQSTSISNPLSVTMMSGGLAASGTDPALFSSATSLCPSSGGLLSTPYANQPTCLSTIPMSNGQYGPPQPPPDSNMASAPFGISLVCSQANQSAVGLLLPHDGNNDGSCMPQSNSSSLVYSISGQPMLAPTQPSQVLTAVSSSAQLNFSAYPTSSASSSSCQQFSTSVTSDLLASSVNPLTSLRPPQSCINGMLSTNLQSAMLPTGNMVFSTGTVPNLASLQPTEPNLSTFDANCSQVTQIGDNMDQDDLLTLAWRLTQEDFDTTVHHNPTEGNVLSSDQTFIDPSLGIYAPAPNCHLTEFVDYEQVYVEQQQQQQHQQQQQDVVEAESDEVVLLDATTPCPALVHSQSEQNREPVNEPLPDANTPSASESTGNADIDALLAAAAQIGAASGVGDAQSAVAVAVPVSSTLPTSPVEPNQLDMTSVTTLSACETVVSTKPVDSATFDSLYQAAESRKSSTSLEQAADDLLFAEFPTTNSGADVNFGGVDTPSNVIVVPTDVTFDGTDEPTSLAAVLGCNAEDAADLESVLGPEANEVGCSGPVSHSFLNSLVGDEAGVVEPHIFDEDFTVCGDGNVLDKCFDNPSAGDIETDLSCRSRESDVVIHDENSYSSNNCSVHDTVSTMSFPTPSSKQVRSLLRNTLPAPLSFHFDELSSGRRTGRVENSVTDPTEDVDSVFLGVDFTDDVGEYTTAEQFQEALMLLGPQPNSPNFNLNERCAKSSETNIFTSFSAISANFVTAFNEDQNLEPCLEGSSDAVGDFDDLQLPTSQNDVTSRNTEKSSNVVPPASPLLEAPISSSLKSADADQCKNTDVFNEEQESIVLPGNNSYSPSNSIDMILSGVDKSDHYDQSSKLPAEIVNFTTPHLKVESLSDSSTNVASSPLWSNKKVTNISRSSSLPKLPLSTAPLFSYSGKGRQRCLSAPSFLPLGVQSELFRDISPASTDAAKQDNVPTKSHLPSEHTDGLLASNSDDLASEMAHLASPNCSNLLDETLPTSSIISVLASSSALVEAAFKYTDGAALDSDISPVKSNLESLDKLDRMLESCQRRSQQNLQLTSDSSRPSTTTTSDSDNKSLAVSQEESFTSSSAGSIVKSGESRTSTGIDATTPGLCRTSRSRVTIPRPPQSRVVGKSRRALPTRRQSRQHSLSSRSSRLVQSDSTCPTEVSTEHEASLDASCSFSSRSAVTLSSSDVDSSSGIVDKALVTFGIGSERPLSFGLSIDPVDNGKAPSLIPSVNFTQHLPQLTLSVDGSLFPSAVDPPAGDITEGGDISRPNTSPSTKEGTTTTSTPSPEQNNNNPRETQGRTFPRSRRAKRLTRGRRPSRKTVSPLSMPMIGDELAVWESQPFARFADSNCTLPSFTSVQTEGSMARSLSSQVTTSSGASWLSACKDEAMPFGNTPLIQAFTQVKEFSSTIAPAAASPSDSVNGFTSVVTSESLATLPTSVGVQPSPTETDTSLAVSIDTRKSSPPPKLAAESTGFEPIAVSQSGGMDTSTSSSGSFTSLMTTSLRQPLMVGSAFAKEDRPFVRHPILSAISASTTVAGVTFGSFAGAAAFRATSFSALAAKAAGATTTIPGLCDLKSLTFSDLAKQTNASTGLQQTTGKSWNSPMPPSSSSVSSHHGATSTPLPVVLTVSPSGITPLRCSESDSPTVFQPTPLFQNIILAPSGHSSTKLSTVLDPADRQEKNSPICTLSRSLLPSPVVTSQRDCPVEGSHLVSEPSSVHYEVKQATQSSPPHHQNVAPKLLIRLRGCSPSSASKSRRRGRRKSRFPYVSKVAVTVSNTDNLCVTASADHQAVDTPFRQQQLSPSPQPSEDKQTGVRLHYSQESTPSHVVTPQTSTNLAIVNSSTSVSEHLPNDTSVTGGKDPIDSVADTSLQCSQNTSTPVGVCSPEADMQSTSIRPGQEVDQTTLDKHLSISTDDNVNRVTSVSPLQEAHQDKSNAVDPHCEDEATALRQPLRLRLNLKLTGLQCEQKTKLVRPRASTTEDGSSGSICLKKRKKKHKRKATEQSDDTQLPPVDVTTVSESGDTMLFSMTTTLPQPIVSTGVHSEQASQNQKQLITAFQGRKCGRSRKPRMYKVGLNRSRLIGQNASTDLLHATGPANANKHVLVPSASRTASVTSRRIFSTEKQERRSSSALLVARPWRPVSVFSPKKRSLMISSPPVPTKTTKLVQGSNKSLMRKPRNSVGPPPPSKIARRSRQASPVLNQPIRLVIRLGQQTTSNKCTVETPAAVLDQVHGADASENPSDQSEVEEEEEKAAFFPFYIASEAETYVDLNQAQIHRIPNPAVLAQFAGAYRMTPSNDSSKTALTCASTRSDLISAQESDGAEVFKRQNMFSDAGMLRKNKSRRMGRRAIATRRTADEPNDKVSDRSSNTKNNIKELVFKHAPNHADSIVQNHHQHNGYSLDSVVRLDSTPCPQLPWTSSTMGCSTNPVPASNTTSLLDSIFNTQRRQHQLLDGRSSSVTRAVTEASDPYHHLAPHSLGNSVVAPEQSSSAALGEQQTCRPAVSVNNNTNKSMAVLPDRSGSPASGFMQENNSLSTSPAVLNTIKKPSSSFSLATRPSHAGYHHQEPIFPPETSSVWPLPSQDSLSSFPSAAVSAHLPMVSVDSQQQQQNHHQALAMVYANAALRVKSLEQEQQQRDRMKAYCDRLTSSLLSSTEPSGLPACPAQPQDISLSSSLLPLPHLPPLWQDLNFSSYAYRNHGDDRHLFSEPGQSKLTASNFFLDAGQPDAITQSLFSGGERPGNTVSVSQFSSYPHQTHPNSNLVLRGGTGQNPGNTEGPLRATTDLGPLRVHQGEPRISGW